MILSSEHVLRVLELRIKTTPIIGTLCSVKDPALVWNAMTYFQCYNHGQYVSHPYTELDESIFQNMDLDLFKVYIELLHHWMPPCTSDEIRYTIQYGKKFGYEVTQYKKRISLRRVRYDPKLDGPRH